MPTTYQIADSEVLDELASVMRRFHPRLFNAQVKVQVIMAYNPDGPAVKHGGYPALAQIKIVSLRDRVTKGYDAEVLIDEVLWRELRLRQRSSTLDHELRHIDTVDLTPAEWKALDDGDARLWKVDDLGRPKLRSRKGDWNAGDGFAEVVARWGVDAIEYENMRRCHQRAESARNEGARAVDA